MAARAKTSESEGRQPDPRTTFWTPSDDEVVFYVPPAFWPFSDGGEQKTKQTNKKLYLRTRVTVRGFHPVRWMDDPSWRKSRDWRINIQKPLGFVVGFDLDLLKFAGNITYIHGISVGNKKNLVVRLRGLYCPIIQGLYHKDPY